MRQMPSIHLTSILLLCGAALSAQTLHQWNFTEAAGTGIEAAVNSGGPQFASPGANNNVGDWATDGAGGLRLTGFNTNSETLVNGSVVTLPNLNAGQIQFEYQLSWNLPTTSGVNRSLYIINRDQGGSNRFRWSLNQYSGGTEVFITRDGIGVPEANAAAGLATTGSAILRTVFTFGDVGGSNGVTAIDASISVDGGAFTDLGLSINPYAVNNLNDLRLHGKGTFPDAVGTYYIQMDAITVSAVPEPSLYGLVLGGLVLGFLSWRRRR